MICYFRVLDSDVVSEQEVSREDIRWRDESMAQLFGQRISRCSSLWSFDFPFVTNDSAYAKLL